ncbi:MAG: hypothetical protein DI597_02760 [Pseudoxanthomonas spadix]|nr:MAG: hypothetical protein DI597_02760 [Pseudoxanthomonas spadix]
MPQGVRQHARMLQGRTCRFRIGKPCWWVVRGRTQTPLRMPGKRKTPGFSGPEGIRSASGDRRWPISRGVDRRQRLSALCAPCAASSARRPATRSSCVMRMIWWRGWKFMVLDSMD